MKKEEENKYYNPQTDYVAASKDIFHRDLCNNIANNNFDEKVVETGGKIAGYTTYGKENKYDNPQTDYVAASKDIFHRDLCNNITNNNFNEKVVEIEGKIAGYTTYGKENKYEE